MESKTNSESHRSELISVSRSGLVEEVSIPFSQSFELYHNAFSLCSMKVRLCLSELGLAYKSHHIDLIETGSYENIRRSFKQVNPGCTVPLLVHNGHPVYESHEQIRYLGTHAGEGASSLLPGETNLHARMEHWIDLSSLTDDPLQNTHLSAGNAVPGLTLPLFVTMIEKIPYYRIAEGFLFHFDKRRPMMFTAMKLFGLNVFNKVELLRRAIEVSSIDMQAHINKLEEQLTEVPGQWIIGGQFTLADVSWMVIFERLRQADSLDLFINPNETPACCAWWQACIARPAYTEAIVAHEHPIVRYGIERLRSLRFSNPVVKAH